MLRHPLAALSSLLGGRRISFLVLQDWQADFHTWIEPFQEAARKYNCYVCPGSSFLPAFDWEIARGWHRRNAQVYNTSCLINPHGRLLGWTRKVKLTPDEKALGISGGSETELLPYRTEIGCLGLLVCLDGFHEALVQRLDRQGCTMVIQPSANPKPWNEPPRRGIDISQEQEWFQFGLGKLIQGRESLRSALNPMSVSSVLGHSDEGRSNLFINTTADRPATVRTIDKDHIPVDKHQRYSGLTALAKTYDLEEIISLRFEK
jgi:hypothetical protein